MKKILFLIILFIGCDSSKLEEESYSIEDAIGTWQLLSSAIDMNISMNIVTALSSASEQDCEDMGGGYVSGSCIIAPEYIQMIGSSACEMLGGILDNNNLCSSINQEIEMCCSDSESITYTIEASGTMTIISIDEDGEEVSTGHISINGSTVTLADRDQVEMVGSISLSGNIMTLSFLVDNNFLETMSADQSDIDISAFSEAITEMLLSMEIIMQKIN